MTSTSYHADFFRVLAAHEDGHFWFRARNRLIAWAIARYFPDARNLLEVGCGTGYVLGGLRAARPHLELTGVELFEEGLAVARERLSGVELKQGDVFDLGIRSSFDVVGAFDVLEHLDDDGEAMRRLADTARPGGGILVTVPQHVWLWSAADEIAEHKRRYTRRGLLRIAQSAGVEPLRMTSFVSLLLPAMAAVRLRSVDADSFSFEDEFRIGARLNRLFGQAMAVERTAIRAGFSFPAGGSLLLVGRRR